MCVGVEDHYRAGRQFRGDFMNVGDAHAGVEENRLFVADDEIRNGFFRLVRFVDGEDSWRDLVDLEPRIRWQDTFEGLVFRARKILAPVRTDGLRGKRRKKI